MSVMAKAKKTIRRPCIERGCEPCIEAELIENMYAQQGAAFEQAHKMMLAEAGNYFTAGKDDMARAFREFAKKFEALGIENRTKQTDAAAEEIECLTPV